MTQIIIQPSCPCIGKSLVDLTLGNSITITTIQRNGRFMTPEGSSKIESGDHLTVMTDDDFAMRKFNKIFGIGNE